MNEHKPPCKHPQHLKAYNVTTIVRHEHLSSDARFSKEGILMPSDREGQEVSYKMIEFCGNPVCGRVFNAVRPT